MRQLGIAFVALLCIVAVAAATYRHQGQSPAFSGPFFSGAANLDPLRPFEWRVCLDQLAQFRDLDVEALDRFRFQSCGNPHRFEFNEIGFMWASFIARNAFPFLSDRHAVITLQLVVHGVVVLIVLALLRTVSARVTFFCLYAINPVVVYFVQFPYRYFWTCLASLAFLLAIYKVPWRNSSVLVFGVLSPILFFIRQTVLPLQLLTFLGLATKRRFWTAIAATALFAAAVALAPKQQKGPWHTIYVGIGAYPNAYMEGLSDNNGYALFERETGKKLLLSSPDDNYYQREVYETYNKILRKEIKRIGSEEPQMLLRNAVLNVLQSYSVGHPIGRPMWAYFSAVIGAMVMGFLLATKQYWLFLGIGAVSAGFAPYFPPIPAYMFGGYLLLAFAAANTVERVWSRRGRLRGGGEVAALGK